MNRIRTNPGFGGLDGFEKEYLLLQARKNERRSHWLHSINNPIANR